MKSPTHDCFRLESRAARIAAGIAALGFLAALGFVPGWDRRLFGFSGFFGFIGVAFIIEIVHQVRAKMGRAQIKERGL